MRRSPNLAKGSFTLRYAMMGERLRGRAFRFRSDDRCPRPPPGFLHQSR
jgi:hypothetical protein